MEFQIKYKPGCGFDNTLDIIKKGINKKYPQLADSVEYINDGEKGFLQAYHNGLLFYSTNLTMKNPDVSGLYAAIEEILEEDEE